MNDQEIIQLRKLTRVSELDRKVRRNFHKWTPEQLQNILFLIRLAIEQIDKMSRSLSRRKGLQIRKFAKVKEET